jgi:transposase
MRIIKVAKQRRTYTNDFKARVALEALTGEKTLNELAGEYGVLAQQVRTWKNELQIRAAELFEKKNKPHEIDPVQKEEITSPLFQQIGQLKVENDWLKKKLGPYL